jgi:hypothetical protein
MKRMALLLVLAAASTYFSLDIVSAGIVCNEFDVIAEVSGREVIFRLSTDLPNDTTVMVSVSRLYWREGSGEVYVGSYFNRRTSVRELKQPVRVMIDDSRWKNDLKKKQKIFASFGAPFQVRKISDEIELDLTVPANQSNPAFGEGNSNLEGPFVSRKGLRTIRVERKFSFPWFPSSIPFGEMGGAELFAKKQYSPDPYDLRVNLLYKISKKTPISREREPKDPLKAIAEKKYLPPGSVFRVLKKQSSGSMPYYYVRADVRGDTRHKVTGWIYSEALMGQDLTVVE